MTATRTGRQKITEAMAPTLRYVFLNNSLPSSTELEWEHVQGSNACRCVLTASLRIITLVHKDVYSKRVKT